MHDELLQHQAFLERLARRLVVDESAAQDLVQDTWLCALSRPRREPGPLRGWLGSVARHLALDRARGSRRRSEREREAARGEGVEGDQARVDRRLDFQVLLLERLRALPEAQRYALSLRYVEDLAPHEIARQLGVSVHTVKARLRRGLATLREELDRRTGGDRAAWAVALLPELARRSMETAGSATGSAMLLGGGTLMTMTAKVTAAALVTVTLAGGWWLLAGDDGLEPTAPEQQVVLAAPAEVGAESLPAGAARELDATPSVAREALSAPPQAAPAAAPPETGSGWNLRVELGGSFGGEPARITVRGRWSRYQRPQDLEVSVELAAPGSVLLDVSELMVLAPGEDGDRPPLALTVEASHPACAPAHVEVPLELDLDPARPPLQPLVAQLALHPGAVLVGRVEQPAASGGLPWILAFEREGPGWARNSTAATRPEPDAAFRLVVPHAGPHLVVAVLHDARPASVAVAAHLGRETDLGLLRLERGASIEGVVLSGRSPAALHRIQSNGLGSSSDLLFLPVDASPPAVLTLAGERVELGSTWTLADPEGRFQVRGLAPGSRHDLTLGVPHGTHALDLMGGRPRRALSVVAPAHDVVLETDWSTIEPVLDLAPAVPVSGSLTVTVADGEPHVAPLRDARLPLIACEPGAAVLLELELMGYRSERVELFAPPLGERETVHLSPVLGPEPATLVLVLEGPRPPEGTIFFLHDLQDPLLRGRGPVSHQRHIFLDQQARRLPLEAGRILVEGLRPGRQHLLLYAGDAPDRRITSLLDIEVDLELPKGGRVEQRVELVEGGQLRLDVTDSEGRRAPARAVLEVPAGTPEVWYRARGPGEHGSMSSHQLGTQAPNDVVQNLPAGRYRLRLELDGHATEELDVDLRPGERTELRIQMQRH